jgi:hypothetical protein
MNQVALKNTAEVSLSSLLRTFDFFHPERHTDKANKDAIRSAPGSWWCPEY